MGNLLCGDVCWHDCGDGMAGLIGWRLPIRIAGDVPVIAVFTERGVEHETAPQTPEEKEWLEQGNATDG